MESAKQALVSYSAVDEGKVWRPGVIARLPWAGVGAVIGALAGTAVSIIILMRADESQIDHWKLQPSTCLSIASTITNMLIGFALSEGVAIAWWTKSLKDNTRLGDLHRYWNFGSSAWSASTSGRHFNLVALATLVTIFSKANGPLLQRAVTPNPTPATVHGGTRLRIPAIEALDANHATGVLSGRNYALGGLTETFSRVLQNFYSGSTISLNNTGCAGICSGRIKAAGLAVNCSTYETPFNIVQVPGQPLNFNSTFVFSSSFEWYPRESSIFSMRNTYKTTMECQGVLINKVCSFQVATVRYPIIINKNLSSIDLAPGTDIFDDHVEEIQYVGVESYSQPTILGGFHGALSDRFSSSLNLRFAGAAGYTKSLNGYTAAQYGNTSNPFLSDCAINFVDPTPDLLQQTRQLMFRTALAYGNTSSPQTIDALETASVLVYQSNYGFLALATIITLIPALAILALFYGYWRLGRQVSMSPLEIAKAFDAPLLRGEDSNAEIGELVKGVGGKKVRYGAVGEMELRSQDTIYGNGLGDGEERPRTRLQIARADTVVEPQKGWVF